MDKRANDKHCKQAKDDLSDYKTVFNQENFGETPSLRVLPRTGYPDENFKVVSLQVNLLTAL